MSSAQNFVDYIFCPTKLSQEVDAIPTLEGKKAFAKKWIGSFLNSMVMGIPKTTGRMEFCPTSGLPNSISYYKLTIRQQLLCKFVILLMDRACFNIQEFEAAVPEMYQYMALSIAISLANSKTAASYSGLQDLSSEAAAKPLPQSKHDDLFFNSKSIHERPEMLFRFWAMRTFCKLAKTEPPLGDVNMHFKRAADVFLASGHPTEGLSAEDYCGVISYLALYTFYLNQFIPTVKMINLCFEKKNELKSKR
ncbi:hypothetical protein DSO57_1000047 [Entomophthora muscae]|uniref:Uncharacterized protein n=1 Tax=Entomophthora muscae TaxID=34485 RepID=A0ACC2SM49_9FUNG|nr:hypothetical protein DSO57_1000047 [Entomophthora muscae]